MKHLQGKRALITGAGSGIGRAIAIELAHAGTDLVLVDIDEGRLQQLQNDPQLANVDVIIERCDVSDPVEIDQCIERVLSKCQSIDILINNAGVCYYGTMKQTGIEAFDRLLAINLQAPIRFTKNLLPVLQDRPESHILNVASLYGLIATNRCSAYHASKFGLVGFSQSLRAEFCKSNLGVSLLCPGFVWTDLFDAMERDADHPVRKPPKYLCTTPERIARKAVRAIKRNKHLIVVTPFAHWMFFIQRMFPSLIANSYGFSPFKRTRKWIKESLGSLFGKTKNKSLKQKVESYDR